MRRFELQVRGTHERTCATIGGNQFLTAKMRRARREETGKRTREEIGPIAAQVVDAMLEVDRALGPGLLESTEGRDQAHGQRVMGGSIDFLCALGIFAV
jgi:hypothetical protein